MKRRKLSAVHCHASIVKLNVGGRSFHTTADTLSLCDYFKPVLNGRISHGRDERGHLFIDRNPDLFAVLLQFLRTSQRPATLADKHALLHECDYFGVQWLAQLLRGGISPFDLRPCDRLLRQQEEDAKRDASMYKLIDVFTEDTSLQPREALQIPFLHLSDIGRPELEGTFEDFHQRLNTWSGHLIEDLAGIPGIVIAGGAVLSTLVRGSASDIDIFLTSQAEAEGVLRQIFAAVQKNNRARSGGKKLLATRSARAITMYRARGTDLCAPPVQVILQVHESVATLLFSFDVDCCSFAFLPGRRGRVHHGARSARSSPQHQRG